MKPIHAKAVLRSAQRLAEGEIYYKASNDPVWLAFLKKESLILLKRAIKVWLRLRFRRVK